MTTDELDMFFERKHNEVLDKLLGPAKPHKLPSPVTTRLVSPITRKSPDEEFSYVQPANPNPAAFMPWLAWYNEQRRICNHKIVTYIEDEQSAEAGEQPPAK